MGWVRALATVAPLVCLVSRAAAWDYVTNGNNWKKLGVCGRPEVNKQSPIALSDAMAQIDASGSLMFRYPNVGEPVRLYNNGHSLTMTLPEFYKGGFSFSEKRDILETSNPIFRIYQVRWHSPSEHTINGDRMPLEMQLVHKDVSGHQIAIISVIYGKDGPSNELLNVLTEYGLPKNPWDEVFVNNAAQWQDREPGPHAKDIDLRFAVNGSSYYTYTGSLTTPPCDSDVLYYVRQKPLSVPHDQLDMFAKVLRQVSPPRGNYRATQPLNGRQVRLVTSTDLFNPDQFDPVVLPKFVPPGPPPLIVDSDVINNPEFEEIHNGDSQELREAKRQVQLKSTNLESARKGRLAKQANANTWNGKYAGASSPIAKIDIKWKVIKAERKVGGADVAKANTEKAYRQAVDAAKDVLTKEKIAKDAATSKPPTAPGAPTAPTATTAPTGSKPTDFPPTPTEIPGYKLGYKTPIKFARGAAGNPFITGWESTNAETQARIGDLPGMVRSQPELLGPSLRQPDGPHGQFPCPSLEKVPTTTAPPTTTPPANSTANSTIEIEVDPGTSEDDAVKQAAAAAGVSPEDLEAVPQLLQAADVQPEVKAALLPRTVRIRPWGHGL